jgi:hypothetical protein
MAFYDLSKQDRLKLVESIKEAILKDLKKSDFQRTTEYFGGEDTYIRKAAYLSVGRLYFESEDLRQPLMRFLRDMIGSPDYKVRQTVINAAGEIGKKDFSAVREFFDQGLFDTHHAPRNAVIGSVKKMGEVNPNPVLAWAREYLHHEDKEIRREICHGIELRGRMYPQDILPLLRELQFDKTARVRNTLVHVIGQISYKKGCLPTVVTHLKTWENQLLVTQALQEIIDVHDRYSNFAALTQSEARQYIEDHS